MTSSITKTTATGAAERVEAPFTLPRLGEWFWFSSWKEQVPRGEALRPADDGRLLVCVTDLGSNYVEVAAPLLSDSSTTACYFRVHLDVLEESLAPAPEAKDWLASQIRQSQQQAQQTMQEIHELTRRLGVGQQRTLTEGLHTVTSTLAQSSGRRPVDEFKALLVQAQKQELPQLFDRLERQNRISSRWMTAELLPLQGSRDEMQATIKRIEERVFHVELYAGLVEQVVKVRDGAPASHATPVHLMQRMHFMDEECLLDYDAGGMTFKQLEEFDSWLARPHNLSRLMPHERCVIAMRVRREEKDDSLELPDNILTYIWMRIEQRKEDKQTYLYLRNGEQLFRLNTALEFKEQLFPDEHFRHLTGVVYARQDTWQRGWDIISEGDYLERVQKAEEELRTLSERRRKVREEAESWLNEPTNAIYFRGTPPQLVDSSDKRSNDDTIDEIIRHGVHGDDRHTGSETWKYPSLCHESFSVRVALMVDYGYSIREACFVDASGTASFRCNDVATQVDFAETTLKLKDGQNVSIETLYNRGRALMEHQKRDAEKLPVLAEVRSWDEMWRLSHDLPRDPRAPMHPETLYERIDQSSVNYDDVMAVLKEQRDHHNKLVLVLQGLLDRSEVFHPHPQWQLFTDVGFNAGLVLEHDTSRALVPGAAPDFEAFRARHNAGIKPGSLVTGASSYFTRLRRQQEKERVRYSVNGRRLERHSYLEDHNPGPGAVARVVRLSRDKKSAVFTWTRTRELRDGSHTTSTQTLTVPLSELLCIDRYKAGDYKQFYEDPRTRRDYLQWAPLLLAAEDFVRQKRKAREPAQETTS